jgi:hypothetical protein
MKKKGNNTTEKRSHFEVEFAPEPAPQSCKNSPFLEAKIEAKKALIFSAKDAVQVAKTIIFDGF